ncbi:MAG: hypothetical protein ACJA2S_002517 [Cyclobacteriaceae bacterium]|jgi:hypothetical protein
MKFECKNIEIADDELGYTLIFSDQKEHVFEGDVLVQEAIEPLGQYVMLQRTYGEEEEDNYYVELSEFEDSGELANFQINLARNQFSM